MAKVKVTNKSLQVINLLMGKKKPHNLQLLPKESAIVEKKDLSNHASVLKNRKIIEVKEIKEYIEVD